MMDGGTALNEVEVVSSGTSGSRKLAAIVGDVAGNAYRPAGVEVVRSESILMPAQVEAPSVLSIRRYAQTLALGDFFIVAATMAVAGGEFSQPGWVLFVSALVAYPAWMFILRLYDAGTFEKVAGCLLRTTLATTLAAGSLYLVLTLSGFDVPAVILGKQVLVACLAVSCWRLLHNVVVRRQTIKTPVLVAGAGSRGMAIYNLLKSPYSPFRIEGFLDDNVQTGSRIGSQTVVGTCLDLIKVAALTGAKQVIVAMSRNRDSESVRNITEARMKGFVVREMTDVYEEIAGRIPVNFIDHNWLVSARGFSLLYNRCLWFMKRLADVVFSVVLGLSLLPVFLLVAILIKVDSQGPVFYQQKRVGKDGKVFRIFKFRSMIENAELNGARWAQESDPRVTHVGRYIRKLRLDELPQIWNILKGEMSFIGPRPERPEFVAILEKQIPHYSLRHTVKPGVTGWAQVILRYGASVNDALDKLEADLYYIKNMSLFLDLKILMRTVGVVLLSQGSR